MAGLVLVELVTGNNLGIFDVKIKIEQYFFVNYTESICIMLPLRLR